MSVTAPQFKVDAIGSWGDPDEFTVERERIKAYAAATNDPLAPHAAGDLAPPVFAIVPAFGALAAASTGVIPGDLLMMVLHGEQDFHFHRPIRPDTTVVTRAMPIGVQGRSSGVTVTVKGETRDKATDELLVEQYMMSFVRGAHVDGPTGEAPPGHALDDAQREREPDAVVEQTFDEDQTFRYSEAAGDPMPIHLDDEVAKAMGLPGIIIHGLCTMAFTSVAVIQHACPDDPERLKRLAVRFSKTVRPQQTITTRIWGSGGCSYAYETTSDTGDVVIKDGLAEVANGSS
jgi:acyl dehydratase